MIESPDDIPQRPDLDEGRRADNLRDSNYDVSLYVHRPISREQLLRAINNDLVPCGAQLNPKEAA